MSDTSPTYESRSHESHESPAMPMQDELRLHQSLLDRPGSRADFNTPVLVIDREALDRNIARMAAFAQRRGVKLRPHAKTHKSVAVARRQLAAGAIGLCCAKLGEAEALADGGIDGILITSPVVSRPAIARLIELNSRLSDLLVVVDNPDNVAALSAASGSRPVQIIIDIDPGSHRTGVSSPDSAVDLYRRIDASGNLQYRGVQFYCGTQQHIAGYAERAAAIEGLTQYLQSVIAALATEGAATQIVTGSGTGTHHIDAQLGVFNEWQVGSYAFMDRQYKDCDLSDTRGDSTAAVFEYALFVDARVVSANTRGMATVDAGFKALSTDGGTPTIVDGAPAGSEYRFKGDEHGIIADPSKQHVWRIGDLVRIAVPHCDPTVNLYDAYHVVSGNTLKEIWPVTARGRSR